MISKINFGSIYINARNINKEARVTEFKKVLNDNGIDTYTQVGLKFKGPQEIRENLQDNKIAFLMDSGYWQLVAKNLKQEESIAKELKPLLGNCDFVDDF